jgi:Mn2+/Fe2+ NRAMP family transporter
VLKPPAGNFTFVLFTTGIVSAGLLAIPVMAGSSGYVVGGAFNWSRTLSKPFWQEWRFYGVIVAPGTAVQIAVLCGGPQRRHLPRSAFRVTQIAGNPKLALVAFVVLSRV